MIVPLFHYGDGKLTNTHTHDSAVKEARHRDHTHLIMPLKDSMSATVTGHATYSSGSGEKESWGQETLEGTSKSGYRRASFLSYPKPWFHRYRKPKLTFLRSGLLHVNILN